MEKFRKYHGASAVFAWTGMMALLAAPIQEPTPDSVLFWYVLFPLWSVLIVWSVAGPISYVCVRLPYAWRPYVSQQIWKVTALAVGLLGSAIGPGLFIIHVMVPLSHALESSKHISSTGDAFWIVPLVVGMPLSFIVTCLAAYSPET